MIKTTRVLIIFTISAVLVGLLVLPRIIKSSFLSPAQAQVTESTLPDWMIREQPEYIQWLAQRATQVAGVPTTSAQAQQSVAAWTFMVYMAADNDLEGFAVADINEMEFVGSTEGVNVVVQVDRAELYDTSNEDWTEARRYFITRDTNLSQIASEQVGDKIGETNTGDPESLIDFVTWTAETYPAERYALIIWDHGGSWLGVATDESAEYDDLTLPELDQALQAITQDSNLNQFELIGFDACLMGGFEVYRTISPYSRYAVASAELIPGNGWDYLGILDTLAAGPSLDGAGLGQGIIDSFIYFYTEVVTNYETFNLTLVDLAQSDHVLDAFESLYNVVENDPTTALEAINRARSQTPEFGAFDDPQFVDFWSAADLLEFMQLLSQQVPGTPLGDAANDVYEAGRVMTLYYRGQADAPESNGGVSIFFPRNITLYRQGDRDERYTAEAPVSLSLWQAFLGTFYETAAFASNLATLEGTVEGVSAEDDQALIELGFGSSTISQAAFIVTLDLGNGQSIVIDYSRLTNFEEGETVTWSGDVPWLTNGDTEVPVLVLRSRRDPNVGIVNGKVYRKDGSSIQAQVVFDLTTNRATSVWGFRRTVGTIMPYELHPTAEDIFHPYWLVLGPGNFLIPTPANQQLVFGTEPLYLIWKGASAGAYQIILQLEDAAGNTQQDDLTVVVEGGDDLVLDEVDTGSDDYDQDSILNVNDNCPVTFNPDQADEDDDGVGDVCDLFDDIDTDGDGVPNDQDNCPATYNPNQADSDNDGVGNVCEALSDGDGDGIPDDSDNCLTTYNPYQVDQDGDGIGDDCDPLIDSDNDGIADNVDNCPTVPNPDQADSNGDGTGNACETGTDSDNDGLPDSSDNCPYFYNPDQADSDSDGVGDVCDSDTDTDSDGIPDNTDNCPTVYNPTQQDSDGDGVGDACDTGADSDGDGVGDLLDNCPAVSNPGQQNTDGDTQGDECDNDDDNDGALDGLDNCQFIVNPGQQDVDLDGVGDACDGFVNPILGDRVWHDINANGLQDAGELGLSNVTVNLYTQGGTLTATEITDVNGLYQFTGMPAGSYFLEFRPRPSYFISPRDLGSDSQDSDPRPTNGRTNVFTLVEGGNNAAFDAGMYMNAAVGDLVWNDADANGIQDGGEPGLSGLTVTLYSAAGTVIDTTTSDASGGYRFAELVPGSYYLRFSAPSANDFSPQNQGADDTLDSDVDSSGQTTPFTLISGEINPTLDAGQYEISKISNRVWLDENGNGIQDTGEDNLSGTNVTLYRSGGTFVASDTTDSSGHYLMDRLPPGSYYLQFAALSGHVFTLQDQGADDTADSDANSSGQTAVFTFPQGTDDTTRDAGMYVPVEVQGRVWEDMDADGIQDAGEPDLSGVTVQLWSGGPTLVGTQTTLADGSYTFTGLRPGLTYHVQVYTFGAYLFSPQNQGGNDALDSDANLSTGETASVTPVSGATVDFDAGMYRLVEIGGLVWHDLNADGVQAGGEPALSGITVRLWNGGTLLNTQTTLVGGDYNFGGLLPGRNYHIQVLPLGSYNFSPQDQGGNDALDSDVNPTNGQSTPFMPISGAVADLDAGQYQDAQFEGSVWRDLNANGIQDGGEAGLNNVTVDLYTSGGALVDTQTTNASGTYSFTAIMPGSYYVQFTALSGYLFSPQDQGGDDTLDSDPAQASGQTVVYTAISGEIVDRDAGMYQNAEINGQIWEDLDADGIQDAGEPGGDQGTTITLYTGVGTVVNSTTPNSGGNYSFTGLTPGNYYLEFGWPGLGSLSHSPADQGGDDTLDSDPAVAGTYQTAVYTLTSGENETSIDAGWYFRPYLSVSDPWNDLDADGTLDGGEVSLPGASTITLYDSSDTVITSGTSGFAGWFAPGTYYVTYTLPNGTLFSPSGPDNDVDASGRTSNFTLISGSSENIGAGVYQPVTFMGRTWRDLNADGIQDGGEPDQPGLTVQLWYSPGAQVGSFTTLADGSYSFANILPARSYEVRFGLPGGYHFSQPNQGGDDALDSDAATATGIAGPVTPTAGSTVDLDAGTYQDVVFSGRVWHDQNANGIQDGGEPGLGGMGVDLHTSVGVLNTSTLADGSYTFTVTPGNGSIFFNLTAGYYFSPQNAGGDDTVDSDANPSTGAGGSAFLTSEQTIDFDAGAYQYASVGDRFWHDLDGDGIQDGGEPGGVNNPGVTSVNLYTSGGSLVSSFTPDASGSYSFTNVTPGSYYFSVNWGPITELHTSPPNQGGNDNQDSDLESLTQTAIFALTSGQNTTAYDFGFWFSTAIAIGDPWNDLNSDGVKDAGEPDLPGISTISLYDSSDNLLWSGTSGIYYWGNVGTFYVTYSLPSGYVFSPLGTDNDVDASGRTANFTLNSTQSIGIQAGMYMP